MKFLLVTLISHGADPLAGARKTPAERLHEVIDKAVRAEEHSTLDDLSGGRHESFQSDVAPIPGDRIPSRPLVANARKVLT